MADDFTKEFLMENIDEVFLRVAEDRESVNWDWSKRAMTIVLGHLFPPCILCARRTQSFCTIPHYS